MLNKRVKETSLLIPYFSENILFLTNRGELKLNVSLGTD